MAAVKSWLKPVSKQPEGGLGPWRLVFLEFDEENGKGCPYIVQTLPSQICDDNKPGDMKKGATDHGCDEAIARELGIREDDHAEAVAETIGDVWQ